MKSTEIRQKNKEQIITLVHDQREKLKELKFGSAGSKEKNVKLTKTLKKGIARLLTILNETVPGKIEKEARLPSPEGSANGGQVKVKAEKSVVKAKKVKVIKE